MKHKKPNIVVNNKAEFKQSLAHYFRFEKEYRDETHAGLKILFEINPPKFEYSNFDYNCNTKFVAKIVDDHTFQKFWKDACLWNETFTFKYVDAETKEQFDEFLKTEIYKVCWGPTDQAGLYSTHDNIKDAMTSWSKACAECQDQIDVYIEKHTKTVEVVVARRNIVND